MMQVIGSRHKYHKEKHETVLDATNMSHHQNAEQSYNLKTANKAFRKCGRGEQRGNNSVKKL